MAIENKREYELAVKATQEGLDDVLRQLGDFQGKLNEAQQEAGEFSGKGAQLDRVLGQVRDSLRGITSSIDDSAKSVRAAGGSWDDYTARLKEADKAYQEFRKGQVTGQGGGLDPRSLSVSQQEDLVKTSRAQSASLVPSLAAGLDERAGRNYLNMSTQIDSAIKQREQSSRAFASSLRAQMQAEGQASKVTEEHTGSIISLRYALYDVATTANTAAIALAAVPAASVAAFASVESSFTAVERTSDGTAASVGQLRGDLMDLTREIPATFGEVSEIAALGNQLGVASGDVAGFTETVAKFSTVTGMSVDESATAFGSLGELLNVSASEYENLGSAIALVGRKSVATESEIVGMATRLAASANNAGFTTEQVIALSGAFASLRIQPERAQGVMEKYFSVLNTALANGGPRLEAFAQYAGMTADEVQKLARTDPNAFFGDLAAGLGELDSVSQTRALQQLGLDGLRAGEVFSRVSGNLEVFTQALSDANQGYAEGTELNDQYGKVLDDLATKFQLLLNAITELGATAGQALAPVIGPLLDVLTGLITGFSDLLQTPAGQWAAGAALAFMGLGAALLGIVGVGALGLASMAALKTAIDQLSASGAVASLSFRGLAGSLQASAVAAGVSTGAIRTFKVALASTGIGLAVVALGTLAAAFMQAGDSATAAFDKYIGTTAGLQEAVSADTQRYQQAVENGNTVLADSYYVVNGAIQENTAEQGNNAQATANAASILGVAPPAYDSATGSINDNTVALGQNTEAWIKNQFMQSDAFKELAGNDEFMAYWNELSKVGANFDDMIAAAAADGEQGVAAYFKRLEAAAIAGGASFQSAFKASAAVDAAGLGASNLNLASGWAGFGTDAGRGVSGLSGALTGLVNQTKLFAGASTAASGGVADLTGANDELASIQEQINADLNTGSKAAGGYGGAASSAAKEVRTLKDYANDLSGVFNRAFEIRFSGGQALDQITAGWRDIAKASADAKQKMAEYRAELATLASDKKIKQYWLSVAENYGDELRATKLRAELAELNTKQAKTSKDLSSAQSDASKSLTGNSDAAIKNRATILGMVGSYQEYLVALAASGASQEELERKSKELKEEFIKQATQMGFSRTEVNKFAKSFNDLTTIIKKVPRNITIRANANPAITALREYESALNKARANAKRGMPTVSPGINGRAVKAQALMGEIDALNMSLKQMKNNGVYTGGAYILEQLKAKRRALSALGYERGGYTGGGGTKDVAGVVHGQEYVFSAPAVRTLGLSNLGYMHEQAKRGKAVAPAGAGGGSGEVMAYLSPADKALLQQISDRVGLNISGTALQKTVGAGNVNSSNRGSA